MIPLARVRVLHRVTALILLMMLSPLTYASAACTGWSGSAADRMACCQRSGDGCASLSADDCCAEGEQRQNVEQVAAALITPGATVSHAIPAVARRPHSFVSDSPSLTERPDIYLLDSVFLI
jgi:hypothetical protein